jgi:nitrogen fixation/metabolism regulation signal transduction histidine kinase
MMPLAAWISRKRALSASESGYIELSEPLHGERRHVRSILVDSTRTTTVLVLVMAALSATLGAWLVGGPMRKLADKARRVGRGDFSGPLHLRRRDEVGDLAREMDAMCAQLVDAERPEGASRSSGASCRGPTRRSGS